MLFAKSSFVITMFFIVPTLLWSQYRIEINNPSFDLVEHVDFDANTGEALAKEVGHAPYPWSECIDFLNSTSTNLLVAPNPSYLKDIRTPYHGNKYLALETETNLPFFYTSVLLKERLFPENCYVISIYLAHSKEYIVRKDSIQKSYPEAGHLLVSGGLFPCKFDTLYAVSTLVDHEDWRVYNFYFKPNTVVDFLSFGLISNAKIADPKAHILIDNLSDVYEIDCSKFPTDTTKIQTPPALPSTPFFNSNHLIPASYVPWLNGINLQPTLADFDPEEFEILVPPDADLDYLKLLKDKYGKQVIRFVITAEKKTGLKRLRRAVERFMRYWDYPEWAYTYEEKLIEY